MLPRSRSNSVLAPKPYTTGGLAVFRILCHFFIISKKEMIYDQTYFRHRRRHQGTAYGKRPQR